MNNIYLEQSILNYHKIFIRQLINSGQLEHLKRDSSFFTFLSTMQLPDLNLNKTEVDKEVDYVYKEILGLIMSELSKDLKCRQTYFYSENIKPFNGNKGELVSALMDKSKDELNEEFKTKLKNKLKDNGFGVQETHKDMDMWIISW